MQREDLKSYHKAQQYVSIHTIGERGFVVHSTELSYPVYLSDIVDANYLFSGLVNMLNRQ